MTVTNYFSPVGEEQSGCAAGTGSSQRWCARLSGDSLQRASAADCRAPCRVCTAVSAPAGRTGVWGPGAGYGRVHKACSNPRARPAHPRQLHHQGWFTMSQPAGAAHSIMQNMQVSLVLPHVMALPSTSWVQPPESAAPAASCPWQCSHHHTSSLGSACRLCRPASRVEWLLA